MVVTSASESAADRIAAQVGTEPVEKVLREAGMTTTPTGTERWRALLRKPIPADAVAEGHRRLAEARTEAHGAAA